MVPNGPADQAGLKDGDVVMEFDGRKIADNRQLQLIVAEAKVGAKVPVEILRNGGRKTLEVTIKPLPSTEALAETDSQNGKDTGTLNGVDVGDLDSQVREQFHIPAVVQGAVVTQVDSGSAAAEAGLKPGDVIESINLFDWQLLMTTNSPVMPLALTVTNLNDPARYYRVQISP